MAKRRKKQKRRMKKPFRIALIVLILLIVAVGAFASVVAFAPQVRIFPVNQIVVSGQSPYSDAQLIDASGIVPETSVFRAGFFGAAEKICDRYPYIKDASVHYALNGTVAIRVTETTASEQICIGYEYYLLDDSHKVLDQRYKRNENMLFLAGLTLPEEIVIGKRPINDKTPGYAVAKKILDAAAANGDSLNIVDVSDNNHLVAVYQNRLYLEIGDEENLTEKFRFFHAILKEIKEDTTGRLLLNQWSNDNRKISLIEQEIDPLLADY